MGRESLTSLTVQRGVSQPQHPPRSEDHPGGRCQHPDRRPCTHTQCTLLYYGSLITPPNKDVTESTVCHVAERPMNLSERRARTSPG